MKTFENKRYSYTIDFPSDWYLSVLEDRFMIENFPPSKGTRGSRLAEGGAAIVVIVPKEIAPSQSEAPPDLEGWVKMGAKHEEVISRRSLDVETSAGRTPAIEIKSICCAVPPLQESLELYFRIGNEYFKATLIHWPNAPDTKSLEEAFKQVVRSIRVVRAPSGK